MSTKKREKPKHLGRGLQSLLSPITQEASSMELDAAMNPKTPNYPPDKDLHLALREINVASITPNPYQETVYRLLYRYQIVRHLIHPPIF